VTGPLQVVCLEGWCLGFAPLPAAAAAAAVHPGLPAVNEALRTYAAAIESRCDAWVVVRVGDPNWVFKWRLQAEVEMRAAGKPGLTDEQVADFVARFMPAYKAYLPVRGAARALRCGVCFACADGRLLVRSRSTRTAPRAARGCRGWRWTSTPRARSSARSEARRGRVCVR
jgi:pantothenate kinase-related protein Tda10